MTIKINWTWVKPYKDYNQSKAPVKGGVYEILVQHKDDKYHRYYIGSSDNLNRRYSDHLSQTESNPKIKEGLKKYVCVFDYYVIDSEATRENVENWLYNHHKYSWNDCEPPGDGNLVNVIEEN